MAGLHNMRFVLSFTIVVRFIIFPSIVDGVAGNELNVALGLDGIQSSVFISPAKAALDGYNSTVACTKDTAAHPWWAVDLDKEHNISHVTITSPDKYRYVKGLDNFEVYLSKKSPKEGSPIASTESYTLCGRYSGSVNASQQITVNCDTMASSQTFRFVIVRSADGTAEQLCMAEVAVYGTKVAVSTTPGLKSAATILKSAPGRPSHTETKYGLMNPITVLLVLSPTIVIVVAVVARCVANITKMLLRKAVRSVRSL